jgi:hypothetical protein
MGRRRGEGTYVRPLQQYSVEWVKGQHRMGVGTNNQARFVAEGLAGRQVIDALGAILTAHKLSLYSLEESCSVFLGEAVETLSPKARAAFWLGQGDAGGTAGTSNAT